jgi:hypothetical protein
VDLHGNVEAAPGIHILLEVGSNECHFLFGKLELVSLAPAVNVVFENDGLLVGLEPGEALVGPSVMEVIPHDDSNVLVPLNDAGAKVLVTGYNQEFILGL